MLKISTKSTTKASDENRERTHWKPWRLVRRDMALEGVTDPKEQIIEFRKRVMAKEYMVKPDPTKQGQYLIAEYQGIFDDTVLAKSVEATVERGSSSSMTAEQLQAALTTMSSEVDASLQGFQDANRSRHAKDRPAGDDVAVPEDFLENVDRHEVDGHLQLGGDLAQFLDDETQAAEKKKLAARLEALEDTEAKIKAKDTLAAKVNPVAVRLSSRKLVEKMQATWIGAVDLQVSEGINVLEFLLRRVSEEDLREEPWLPFKQKLDALATAAAAEADSMKAACTELISTIDNESWDLAAGNIKNELKHLADEQKQPTSHQSRTKKMLAEVRVLLSKTAASANPKKRKAGDKATGVPMDIGMALDYRPALNIVQTAVQDGPLGVRNKLDDLEFGVAALIPLTVGTEKLVGIQGFKPLAKWQKEKAASWEGAGPAPAFGAVVQPTVIAEMRQLVKDSAKASLLFRSPYVAVTPKDQALHKAVYGAQVFVIPQGHCQAAPSPFGVNDCRLVTQGEEVIVGVKARVDHSLAEQVGHLKSLNGAQLLAVAKEEGNFAMVIKEGELAVLPCGHVFLIHRPKLTMGLRWAFSAGWPGELSASQMVVASVMEAHAAVRGTLYEQWWEKLKELASEKGGKSEPAGGS